MVADMITDEHFPASHVLYNKLQRLKAEIENRGRHILKAPKKCMIEDCEKPGVISYGPVGIPIKETGYYKDIGYTNLGISDEEEIELVKWKGRKKFIHIWECRKHG